MNKDNIPTKAKQTFEILDAMITPDDVIAFKRVCNKSALGNRAMDSK